VFLTSQYHVQSWSSTCVSVIGDNFKKLWFLDILSGIPYRLYL